MRNAKVLIIVNIPLLAFHLGVLTQTAGGVGLLGGIGCLMSGVAIAASVIWLMMPKQVSP